MSRHDNIQHVKPMHLALSSLSNSTVRYARLDMLDTSNVSCRDMLSQVEFGLMHTFVGKYYIGALSG